MNTITHATQATNLADILERVLDKGLVIAGDIKISLADVDLLTIRIRLLVASVERAREMGINWWEHDPYLTVRSQENGGQKALTGERGNNAGCTQTADPQRVEQKAYAFQTKNTTQY
ncbi:MAG: gas vesicle protein [Bacillota bacterium]